MRSLLSSSGFFRVAGAGAALWVCTTAAGWAGGGGESLGPTLPDILPAACNLVSHSPCPQLPTFSQFALAIAGLGNGPVAMIRTIGQEPDPAVNAANPPLPSAPGLSNPPLTLQNLSPLAFIANQAQITAGQPTPPSSPVPLYASTDHFFADAFFYAVTSQASGQPDTLTLVYDDLSATTQNFTKGQNVAAMSVPLAILNKDNTERPVMTTVQIVASCTGGTSCLTANAIGDFATVGNPQTRTASSVGINFAATFGKSAVSIHDHLIFELQVPLLVTLKTDPAYFWETTNSPNHYPLSPVIGTVFSSDVLGTKFLGSPIGIAPSAGPLCTATTCPVNPPAPAGVVPLCARLPKDGAGIVSAVAAFYAIAVDGEALLSVPINPTKIKNPVVCPPFPF